MKKKDVKYAILAASLLSVSAIGGICKVAANGHGLGYSGYEQHGTGYEAQPAYYGFSGYEHMVQVMKHNQHTMASLDMNSMVQVTRHNEELLSREYLMASETGAWSD